MAKTSKAQFWAIPLSPFLLSTHVRKNGEGNLQGGGGQGTEGDQLSWFAQDRFGFSTKSPAPGEIP